MKSHYVCFEGSRVYVREEELPPLQDQQALIRVSVSLPSVGTELAVLAGSPWEGNRLGYSSVGTVEAVGKGATQFKVGDRLHRMTPHADYAIVPDGAGYCYRVPEGVSDQDAAFATLGAVAMHLVQRARIALGQSVFVLGQGSVGLLTAQIARQAGAGLLVGVDPDATRRRHSLANGANLAIAPEKEPLAAALAQAGADAAAPVFIEVSGSSRAVQWLLDCAPLHSRIVLTGTYLDEVRFNPFILIDRELEIIGAHQPKCPDAQTPYYPYSRRSNYDFFLCSLASGRLKVGPLCDGRLSPAEIPAWYEAAVNRRPRLYQPVLDWWGK